MSSRDRGFSLAELLVALGVATLLAAGVLRVIGALFEALGSTQAALAAQRSLRMAEGHLSDDLQGMGFLVPFRPSGVPGTLFRVEPGRPVPIFFHGRLREAPAPLNGQGLTGDEMTLVQDLVLPGEAHLAEPMPGREAGDSQEVVLVCARRTILLPKDVLLVEDAGWEAMAVLERREVPAGRIMAVPVDRGPGPGPHGAGTPVTLLRPLRRVRYGIAFLPAQPGSPGRMALVRQETDGSGEEGEGHAREPGPADIARVVAVGISRIRVESTPGEGALPRLVKVVLEAESAGPWGVRRRTVLVRAPRNGPGP
jgi:prepilin-type N-terminal cleavage/methylation domain-containing protein